MDNGKVIGNEPRETLSISSLRNQFKQFKAHSITCEQSISTERIC